MKLSNRALQTPNSPIRSPVVPNDSSVRVIKLNIGQPDIASPPEFFAGIEKCTKSVLAYDDAAGNRNLINAWVTTLNKQYNLSLTKNDMLITSGSSEALTFLFSICCDANDEILVFNPTYANYVGFASIAGIKLTSIACSHDERFHMPVDIGDVEKHITQKTKAILICNPNNPSGTVFTDDELKSLVTLCEKHDILLIVDEVYREFVYDDRTPRCVLQIAPKSEHVVVVDSLSKRYSLCGARLGCLITHNNDVMTAAINFASTRVSAPTIEQEAAATMMNTISETYLSDVVAEYTRRRKTLIASLEMIHGVEIVVPEGGFYVLAKLPVEDTQKFTRFVVQDFSMNGETVAIAPAHGFFINDETTKQWVRIAFVVCEDELKRAIEILHYALVVYDTNRAHAK